MPTPVWLRTPRFDLGLQLGALAGIAPALILYASTRASDAAAVLPLAALIAVPFVHVFGSFFFAFSAERNQSRSPPARLAAIWAGWTVAALALFSSIATLVKMHREAGIEAALAEAAEPAST